jgi:hypothetical protein
VSGFRSKSLTQDKALLEAQSTNAGSVKTQAALKAEIKKKARE